MSSQEQAAALLRSLAFSLDGAVVGVALAYAAVRSVLRFNSDSSALHKLREAPSVCVSDLRSVLPSEDSSDRFSDIESSGQSLPLEEKLVIVRGIVEAKASIDVNWKILRHNPLVSRESGDKAVIIQRTQTCIYNEWKGFFGWPYDLRTIFSRSCRERESTSVRMVPFVLAESNQWSTDYVVVNMDGSKHPLPLTTVYHQLQPVNPSPYTLLQALLGQEYPVGLLDEERILPVGKDVSAVGVCILRNGIPEIKSCKDLPYFLSEMSKDQMVLDLAFKTRVLFWSGIILGTLSVGILGFAFMRNWNRWKEWRERRRNQAQATTATEEADEQIVEDDEWGNVPDGQLCVICLMRRRRSAFVPCGHLVCCQRCALSVERELSPKCPVCRQLIRNSVRIYDS